MQRLAALLVVMLVAAGCGDGSDPTVSASPSTDPAQVCPIVDASGPLPSDRLVDVIVATAGTADLITFVFGDPSLGDPPQGAPQGDLTVATPPYTQAGSGEPVVVRGGRVAELRFAGMSIVNDVGQPTYDGPRELYLELPALQSVVNFDMFEGVIGWYIGFDGPGCITLSSDDRRLTVVVNHPPGA